MPLVIIRTTVEVPASQRVELLQACSKLAAKQTGKPEAYVMTVLEPPMAMTMAGTAQPACFVEVRGVGAFKPAQTSSMSEAFCALLAQRLGVDSGRIYLNFTGYDGAMWGHDGGTFG